MKTLATEGRISLGEAILFQLVAVLAMLTLVQSLLAMRPAAPRHAGVGGRAEMGRRAVEAVEAGWLPAGQEAPSGAVYVRPRSPDWMRVCVPELEVRSYPRGSDPVTSRLLDGAVVRIRETTAREGTVWAYIADVQWVDMAGLCAIDR